MEISGLVCPITKTPLVASSSTILSTIDGDVGYPVEEGIPILLGPAAITNKSWPRDKSLPQYEEAYAEMDFYNKAGLQRAEQIRRDGSPRSTGSLSMNHLFRIAQLSSQQLKDFPEPAALWACDNIDAASEVDCYRHIAPIKGKSFLQVGGSGTTALLMLLAGAADATLLTPMRGEAILALTNAVLLNLSLRCIIGIGEELPVADGEVDIVFSGGCVHHMRTGTFFKEVARVLKPGGKFAAIEPWKAPGYTIGTKIFGKREANPYCRPLTQERVRPFLEGLFKSAECIHHGTFTRYPSIVAQKGGLTLSPPKAEWITRIDDAICDCIPGARSLGSGVALLATK